MDSASQRLASSTMESKLAAFPPSEQSCCSGENEDLHSVSEMHRVNGNASINFDDSEDADETSSDEDSNDGTTSSDEEQAEAFSLVATAITNVSNKIDDVTRLLCAAIQQDNIRERQQQLNGELKKIESLSTRQRMLLLRKIGTDHELLNLFFVLNDEDRELFATSLIQEMRV